jgi:hypothetical protein
MCDPIAGAMLLAPQYSNGDLWGCNCGVSGNRTQFKHLSMPLTPFLPRRRCEGEHPPSWNPAPESPHQFGLFHEASKDDWERAEIFCKTHLPNPPRILPSNSIDRIRLLGCAAWGLEHPNTTGFVGRVEKCDQNKPSSGGGAWKVCTQKRCQDTCVMSDLPLMAGLYDIHGRRGIYYEVHVKKMEGVVAIGAFPASPPRATLSCSPSENLNKKTSSDRHGMQTIPILAHARVESSQRRITPR